MQKYQSPRIWLRVYSWAWLNTLYNNFKTSGWIPNSGNPGMRCPIAGFLVHEAFPNVDMARLKTAIDSVRSLGFIAKPGLVWHIGANEPDPTKKWLQWTNRMAWAARCTKVKEMATLQDPSFPGIALDLELYDSVGQESALWSDFEKVYYACDAADMLSNTNLIITQYIESFPQNRAFAYRLKNITWIEEAYWGLPWKEDQAVLDEMTAMQKTKYMLKDVGRGYMPQTVQSICRDYAAPIRNELSNAGIDDVFSWIDSTEDDVNMIGTIAWKTRPKQPKVPPDPSKMGQMVFDLDASKLPVGSCTSFSVDGSVPTTFTALVPANVVADTTRKAYLDFDKTQGQGFRTAFSRQISADYTLVFAGLLPSPKLSNDGTAWHFGSYRFYASQAPSARWNWFGFCPVVEGERCVIVCEQTVNNYSILINGVQIASGPTPKPNVPDGTMTIGNIDSMTSRPCKMELERLTLFEGVNRDKSIELSRQYCQWYGIVCKLLPVV